MRDREEGSRATCLTFVSIFNETEKDLEQINTDVTRIEFEECCKQSSNFERRKIHSSVMLTRRMQFSSINLMSHGEWNQSFESTLQWESSQMSSSSMTQFDDAIKIKAVFFSFSWNHLDGRHLIRMCFFFCSLCSAVQCHLPSNNLLKFKLHHFSLHPTNPRHFYLKRLGEVKKKKTISKQKVIQGAGIAHK